MCCGNIFCRCLTLRRDAGGRRCRAGGVRGDQRESGRSSIGSKVPTRCTSPSWQQSLCIPAPPPRTEPREALLPARPPPSSCRVLSGPVRPVSRRAELVPGHLPSSTRPLPAPPPPLPSSSASYNAPTACVGSTTQRPLVSSRGKGKTRTLAGGPERRAAGQVRPETHRPPCRSRLLGRCQAGVGPVLVLSGKNE